MFLEILYGNWVQTLEYYDVIWQRECRGQTHVEVGDCGYGHVGHVVGRRVLDTAHHSFCYAAPHLPLSYEI